MKNVKRILCMLLVASMMFGIALTNGGVIRAYAANADAPALPLKLDFEGETIDEFPSGWTVKADTLKDRPEAKEDVTVVAEADGNKVLQVLGHPMPNTNSYFVRYEFQPTDSILMKYRFKLTEQADGAYLPCPLYSGKEDWNELNCSPLQFMISGTRLQFGYSDTLSTSVKEGLVADQWYELVMLVDLKSDTRKAYLDGEQLDLSYTESIDYYTDKSEMTMDRISMGMYFAVSGQFFVDDIDILASAKANEVTFDQTDYLIRVNSSVQTEPDFRPLGAVPCALTYTSADPSVATVDENGVITGIKEGTTTISVKTETEGVAPVVLNVTVDKAMTGTFANLPDTLELPLGGHTFLDPSLTLDYEGDNTVVWVSSNPQVVTMDEWGEVYALAEGEAEISFTSVYYPTVTKKVSVTVKKAGVQQTIYVAPNGTGDGSKESKPTSLDNVLSILEGIDNTNMTGNVEVILADGYYYRTEALKLTDKHGGNNLYSVVFKAAEGAKPTIGGALHIAGSDFAESDIPGVYVVDVPAGTDTRQLYVDNVRAIRAKQEGGLKKVTLLKDESSKDIGLICDNPELLNCTNPDDMEIVWYNCWSHRRAGITEIREGADGKVELIMDQPMWDWAWQDNPSMDFKVSQISQIENALYFLDEPGEWYLDETTNKLYYMPRVFEDMSKVTVTVPVLDVWNQDRQENHAAFDETLGLINVYGSDLDHFAQNIHFEGITFADTTWTRPSSVYGYASNEGNYICDGGSGLDDMVPDAAINIRRANGISFYDCVFTRIGGTGVWLTEGARNSMIIGSHLFDIDGIVIMNGEVDFSKDVQNYNPTDVRRVIKNNDVLNNYIHDIGIDYHSATAVAIGFAADIDISYNEMHNMPYSGVHVGYGWNSTTEKYTRNINMSYNYIYDSMISDVNDGGSFYTSSRTSGNNKIFNNYLRNQGSDVAMIYFDSGASGWDILNNVVDVSKISVDAVTGRGIDWSYAASTAHHLTYRNNYYWEADETYFGINSTHTVQENNTRVWGGEWPEEALKIMEEAGLQEAYAGLKNNQLERLYTNLSSGLITPRSTFKKVKLDTDKPEKKTFQVEVTATDGKDQPITLTDEVSYSIDDKTIAYVDENGLVTALKAGETTLRVYVLSNNVLRTMESKVGVTGETVETPPTEEPTRPGQAVDPLVWAIIAVVAVTAVAVVVILLPKKKDKK